MDFEIVKKNSHIHMTPIGGKYTYLIIFLHGLGDCPGSYLEFFQNEDVLPENIPIKIICLQSPFLLRNGFPYPSWFTISKFPVDSEECCDFEEVKKSVHKIESVIEEEVKLLDGKYENIFVGGFSQGACLSLYAALTCKHLLGGVIACSGFLFSQTKISEESKGLKIFVGHGEKDNVISFKLNQESLKPIENLTELNRFTYPNLAHSFCEKEIQDIKNFLTNSMKGK